MNDDRSMPLRQWALEYMGWKSAGQAYKAYKDGRLLLDPNPPGAGVYVMAEASRLRYEQTAHPGFRRRGADVGARFIAPAGEGNASGRDKSRPYEETGEPSTPAQGALDFGAYDYQGAKAKREHYAAERERLNYLREAGELAPVAAVRAAFSSAGAIMRARLESLPAMLAPQLIGMDEAQARALMAEHIEAAQRAAAQAIEKLAGEWGGAA